jgi:biofilm PGA synthesis N-glycosyltransferase PgaC
MSKTLVKDWRDSTKSAAADVEARAPLKLATVVCFHDEEQHLPTLLSSIAAQTQPPEQLLLVDDGSRDSSYLIAAGFADEHSWAQAMRRPSKPPSRDRLASASELLAFRWGLEQLKEPWDVVVKLDADLQLNTELLRVVRKRFSDMPELGITGPYLSALMPNGNLRRERHPRDHVRGATKFYRRSCYEEIAPIPQMLGWDTIDELRARNKGWTTDTFEMPGGDCVHLRPLGTYDGRLRSFRRRGVCAWVYGAHPLRVLLGSLYRMREVPPVLGGLNYLRGWFEAAVRRYPRAESSLRAHMRREDLRQLRGRLRNISARVHDRPRLAPERAATWGTDRPDSRGR